MMNEVKLKNGNTVDIDTVEGSRQYLESEGFDVDKVLDDGWKVFQEIKKKIDEET